MPKTLWYISKYFAPETDDSPGGRGWFLMEELAKQDVIPVVITSDSNNLISVPTFSGSVFFDQHKGVEVVWLKTFKYQVANSFRRIVSWFDFEWKLFRLDKSGLPRPDVVVVSSLSLLTIINGFFLKKKYGARLVFEVRDIWPLTLTEEGGFSDFNPFVKFLSFVEWLGYRYSDVIIGTMPNLIEHVRDVCGGNTPVYCVPMGVSEGHLSGQTALPTSYVEAYLSDTKMKVVYAGTIGITNALNVFFEAAECLKHNSDVQFIVVGDGALRNYYLEKYSHLSNVVFAPKVARHEVQSVLELCDVVYFSVFPSRIWCYGQSLNKLVDYMLSGKPVVASYSGYPSMINEAECGSFIPPGNAEALADELVRYSKMHAEERSEIGERGRIWIRNYRSYPELARQFSDAVFERNTND